MAMTNVIWFASYGSNMFSDCFYMYIQGGVCEYTVSKKSYKGCSDKTLPKASKPILIPYELYFGTRSKHWSGGAAFLDLEKPSVTVGRAWLITKEQFKEIHLEKGKGINWYDKEVVLGKHDGYDVVTVTNKRRLDEIAPSAAYLSAMKIGLADISGNLSDIITF